MTERGTNLTEKSKKKTVKETAKILQKLAHPVRLEVVLKLLENKCCVKEIGENFGLPQATVSQYLKQLRECNIVEDKRKGNNVEYCITDEWLIDLLLFLKTKIKTS